MLVHDLVEHDEEHATEDAASSKPVEMALGESRTREVDRQGGEQGSSPESHEKSDDPVIRTPNL